MERHLNARQPESAGVTGSEAARSTATQETIRRWAQAVETLGSRGGESHLVARYHADGHRFGQGLNKITMVVLTGVSSNLREGFHALSFRARVNRPVATARSERQVQTRLTDAGVTQLIAAYQAGAKINQLATDFGINRNTVSSLIGGSSLITRRHRGLSSSAIAEATALYVAGWSLVRLGDRFGCSTETVRQALQRSGVQCRKPWERPTPSG
jgi:hypothetical protein